MNRDEIEDYYIFIRLWAPPSEVDDYKTAFYPYPTFPEEGGVVWKLARTFEEAGLFKAEKIAVRLVKSIPLFKERIDRGWGYEVLKVTEEIVDTNIKFDDEEEEEAA